MRAQDNMKSMQLRVPEDLKSWLVKQAEQNCRSLNGEIVSVLKQSKAASELQGNLRTE